MPAGRALGETGAMPDLWYRLLLRAITRIYYRRVNVVRLSPVPITDDRPVLFVGLHRNGAIDGMLYKRVFPRAVFVVARQLLRSSFSRLFFTGIPVVRDKDVEDVAARRDNPQSLAAAVDHLTTGGQLFVLPEGTSDLGPRHLPFKPGAAKILAATVDRGITPLVVPVGIFYESAPTFRSDVCIVVGAPIDIDVAAQIEDSRGRVGALMAAITASLEAIAVEARDAETLHRVETIAAIAAGEMAERRWRIQKTLTQSAAPAEMDERWCRLTRDVSDRRTAVDRAGVPRFSRHGVLWNAGWLAVQLAIVLVAGVMNVLPLAGAWLAEKRFADAPNTIALWRILIGTPLAALWVVGVVAATVFSRSLLLLAAYLAITGLGLVAYPELCVRWPMLRNALTRATTRDDAAAIAAWTNDVAA